MATAIPILPSVCPVFSGISITNTTVSVVSGGDIAAAIATAIAGGQRRVLLAAGGAYSLSAHLVIPNHGLAAGTWMELTTDAVLPAIGTKVERNGIPGTYNLPTLTFANGTQLQFAAGAHHWRIRGLQIVGAATDAGFDVNGDHRRMIQPFPDALTKHADIPHHISVCQCVLGGNDQGATNHHGTKNRQGGIFLNASMIDVRDSTIFSLNYGGLDYANQSQSAGAYAGIGRITIDNCNLWGGTESIAFGGASQYTFLDGEQAICSEVTIRNSHIYEPLSVKTFQGRANGIEFKLGRRILIENCIIENVWQELQNGLVFVLWSVNQNSDNPFTQTSDVTIRYCWLRNCSGVASLNTAYGRGEVGMARVRFEHCLATGQGVDPPCPTWRTFDIGTATTAGPADVSIDHCLFVNTGGNYWMVLADKIPMPRFSLTNSIIGTTDNTVTLFFMSSGTNQVAWDSYINSGADCTMAGNGVLLPSGATVNPGTNVNVTTLAGLGLVDSSFLSNTSLAGIADLANLALASNSALKGQGQAGVDPGPDITTLRTNLTGVEMSAAERALYAT